MELTERQKETLIFIQDYIKQNGYAPSCREIGDYFEVYIKSVTDILKVLERKGYIKRDYAVARSIRVIKEVA